MKKHAQLILGSALFFALGFGFNMASSKTSENNDTLSEKVNETNIKTMKLGAFSISLNVKDLQASKQFYEHLGFSVLAGGLEKNYLIMKNENALIGLFQGMFEGNILTFNPGWDENGQNIADFDDIRKIQQLLKSTGIKIDNEVDESTMGPASLMITDPDGNIILIDQHR
jgi:catechol 2,3-dioxygenase-like lactoylglutathione lyase family enzyme